MINLWVIWITVTEIVLQQLFCFMTCNIKHIELIWLALTDTFAWFFDSCTSDLPFDLLYTLLLSYDLSRYFKVHLFTGVLAD